MFYDLKPHAPGEKIKPPNVKNGYCFVQSTSQDLDHCLKAGSFVLYEVRLEVSNIIIMVHGHLLSLFFYRRM